MAGAPTEVPPRAALLSASGLREAAVTLFFPVICFAFAYAHVVSFVQRPRASVALLATFELLFACFYLARRRATVSSTSPWDWATMAGGTFLPFLLRPSAARADLLAGELLQIAGSALVIWGVTSLRRSIGLVPAHRGIQRGGAYRLVRHPLYAGYAAMQLGYLWSNLTAWNTLALSVAFACQVARIHNEERFLSRDPEYVAYRRSTRWRLLPFVY